ncbi:MAG: hypothetical protein AABX72_01565 [Nanoarchaeota archaeon]|mgnify:FL=1
METKGFIRTLEAVIAVMIVLMLLFFILPEEETPTGEVPAPVQNAQRFVLDEIALTKSHRQCVISANQGICGSECPQINNLIQQNVPFGYTSACEICNSALSCATLNLPTEKSVYTDSIFISKKPVTKIVRVYYYEK